jgi:hypothetical protein
MRSLGSPYQTIRATESQTGRPGERLAGSERPFKNRYSARNAEAGSVRAALAHRTRCRHREAGNSARFAGVERVSNEDTILRERRKSRLLGSSAQSPDDPLAQRRGSSHETSEWVFIGESVPSRHYRFVTDGPVETATIVCHTARRAKRHRQEGVMSKSPWRYNDGLVTDTRKVRGM